jgi:hypothetical protein
MVHNSTLNLDRRLEAYKLLDNNQQVQANTAIFGQMNVQQSCHDTGGGAQVYIHVHMYVYLYVDDHAVTGRVGVGVD